MLSDRPPARALAALGFTLAAGSLLVYFAGDLIGAAIAPLERAAAGGALIEAAARLTIPLLILLAGCIGALAFRQPLHIGRHAPLVTAAALPSGVIGVAVIVLLAALAGAAAGRPGPGGAMPAGFALATILILMAVTSEEVLLRGFLQPILTGAWGERVGVALTAAAFTLVHFVGGWRDPISLLNIFLAGIWFGLLALKTGGLVAPILAHGGYNWAEEMLFGASPNPGVGSFGALMNIELVGPAIWGGSVEGLNASLPLSLFLVAMVAALAWPARVGSPARTTA